MKRFIVVLVIIVVIFGFYRGWFTVTSDRDTQSNKLDVNLAIDPDKVKADAESVTDKAAELTGQSTEKTNEPGNP